jgi:hypothetical protein
MSTLLATPTAMEDNAPDSMRMAEDAVVHTARAFAEGFEPIIKPPSELPLGDLVRAPAEVVHHMASTDDQRSEPDETICQVCGTHQAAAMVDFAGRPTPMCFACVASWRAHGWSAVRTCG